MKNLLDYECANSFLDLPNDYSFISQSILKLGNLMTADHFPACSFLLYLPTVCRKPCIFMQFGAKNHAISCICAIFLVPLQRFSFQKV